ncbi:LLM class flavin-dependent oxidoreductase [Paenibacillus sp. YPG26]|uniref:LLM class flavin-dependent oxidoreductase n=1 Tax=Paenibacillus sp. YPG26 TaxID=2878915 RepID=UPI00203C3923|nr:LLM class flavin-dependent oxidoreductase [Paenibacillus sp. YPG26]USB33601.1 LLM class flavin-dependent oxidoreductase [Paenibacillus sp. YPG26]
MGIQLSILDQSPVFGDETPEEAFQHTVELAQIAERLGYSRFWVSEHHDGDKLAGSSPEVLIAYLLAKTNRIRIGSGGVMLQHYSPYKVAENFNVLSSLAPGRVDLGIGRAPGGLPRSTRALQQGAADGADLTGKLKELSQYVHNRLAEDHPLAGLRATPVPGQPADLYLLGASVSSAELAAELGLPYVFALFINSDPVVAEDAFAAYTRFFNYANGTKPQPILALPVVVAGTDAEAEELASQQKLYRVYLDSGKKVTVGSLEQAEEFGRQSNEDYRIEEQLAEVIKGSKETVRRKLLEVGERYGVVEYIVNTALQDFGKRVRSYELLKEAFTEAAVVHTEGSLKEE